MGAPSTAEATAMAVVAPIAAVSKVALTAAEGEKKTVKHFGTWNKSDPI